MTAVLCYNERNRLGWLFKRSRMSIPREKRVIHPAGCVKRGCMEKGNDMDAKAEGITANKSIMRKFIYGILIPLVLILVVTGILLNVRLTKEIEVLQEKNLETQTEAALRLIEEYFEKYVSVIETTAALPIVQDALMEVSQKGESFRESPYHDEMIEILSKVQKLSPEAIQSIYLADFTNSQYLRWDGKTPEDGWDITQRPYYALISEEKSTILTPVFRNVTGSNVVSVSTPVFALDNETMIGSVNIDLGIDSLIESMEAVTVGKEGYIILFDSTDTVISARDEEILLKNVKEAEFPTQVVRMVENKEKGNIEFCYQDIRYCGYVGFADKLNGWCVLGILPDAEYHQPVNNITTIVVVCFVACILILSVLCMIVVRKIIQPLKKLSVVVGELAEGNLYVDCSMKGEDEIGHLAEGVRVLVDRLRTYMLYVSESYEKMEQLAYTDGLTGLGSRMAFNETLKEYGEVKNAACVVADVNNLKMCNDRYGHSEGDKIIIDAAKCICSAFVGIGTCYRIGGDEFCVLLSEGSEEEIRKALDKAEELIDTKNQNRTLPLSVAFGYAVRESMAESMEELFKRSDEMMYDRKNRMKKTKDFHPEPENMTSASESDAEEK